MSSEQGGGDLGGVVAAVVAGALGPPTTDRESPYRGGGSNDTCSSMVTSKGTSLNPNAKVWQEIPPGSTEIIPSGSENSWQEDSPVLGTSEGLSESTGCKQCDVMFPSPTPVPAGSAASVENTIVNGMDSAPVELGFIYEHNRVSAENDTAEEHPVTTEDLRESLKKQVEFCFSRENLSKDLYLMSQMDSDQFVPIWTIANMEGIKKLTTDMDLILDVLRTSPMVQVDEKGEKVRPNHKRCIIILREVPETTPVEEVKSLFKNENCPKVIACEFAHNNNWYITFQSDTDAQQAYRYLREEVKTFQGKPIMARIKAINTFFAKNGYRVLDSSVYPQAQTQTQFPSHLFMQPVYSPQQQYPLFSIVPQAWSPSPTPYFETPLAPFPNGGFVNGFSSPGSFKSPLSLGRQFHRNRNHVKPHPRSSTTDRSSDSCLVNSSPLSDSGSNTRSPQTQRHTGPVIGHQEPASSYTSKESQMEQNGDSTIASRGRRNTYRGGRRRRDEERNARPLPSSETKIQVPKFDLLASNFPPLPGSVASTQGEIVLENRMSDVVKGIGKDKETGKELPSNTVVQEENIHGIALQPTKTTNLQSLVDVPVISTVQLEKPADVLVQKESYLPVSMPVTFQLGTSKPQRTSGSNCTSTAIPIINTSVAPEPRKLSYAEVCQKPPKDPPPIVVQPLRELRTNIAPSAKVEENASPEKTPDKSFEKSEARPKDSSAYRGSGSPRGGASKIKEQRRQFGRRTSPQGPSRRNGKEQNAPPKSPK
ncbi:la-related protein 4 [Protopterus annectens]|uniref:la-related protein 4 n=1 Tax=Protopterus annectens TaxID=7888 RepID=UPI001CFB2514|nr:la-related protein 4 [Protopterus annectens]